MRAVWNVLRAGSLLEWGLGKQLGLFKKKKKKKKKASTALSSSSNGPIELKLVPYCVYRRINIFLAIVDFLCAGVKVHIEPPTEILGDFFFPGAYRL